MAEWQKTGSSKQGSPAGKTVLPAGPLLGQGGTKFLGRVIIEAWEPSDPSSDGIMMSITTAAGGDLGAHQQFSRDAVAKAHARLQKG
ncbi:MAG: hypothetical protein KGJ86_10495 [Chloroflexota bacterium]|nr:hypothetical protein [Chloroflexota bacterium]